MVDESIVNVVRQYLQSLVERGIPVHQGVIFGSHVSDQAHTWSDIDLLVVSPKFDGNRKREDVNLLWHEVQDLGHVPAHRADCRWSTPV